jgi:homoserine kinase
MKRAEITIPASTSNLGASFDACGLALGLYLKVSVEPGHPRFEVELAGELAGRVPADESNLIVKAARHCADRRGRTLEGARLRVESQIPLARGLGSSSSAIIAGISVYEVVTGDKLDQDQFFSIALDFEDHGDNLAPSLLGGLVVAVVVNTQAGRSLVALKRTWASDIRAVLVVPDYEMDTGEMRRALPQSVSLADAVFNLQRSALFQAVIGEGRYELFSEALRDRLHQPYRIPGARGLAAVLRMNDETDRFPGLLGVALSGAGSTMIGFARDNFDAIGAEMKQRLASAGVESRISIAEADNVGRRIEMG